MQFKKMNRKVFLGLTLSSCVLLGLLSGIILLTSARALAPQKAQLVFQSKRDGNWEIYVMDADGKNQRNLTNHPAADFKPSWSPDGQKIAFASFRSKGVQIFEIDSDGNNIQQLTNDIGKVYDRPSWSPDGIKIAFVSDQDRSVDLFVMDTDGKNPRNLTKSLLDGEEWSPAWSPDGQWIAFTFYYTFRPENHRSEIYVIDADGKNPRNLSANHPDMSAKEYERSPAWSPDGRKIVFERDWDIWVMDEDGKNPHRLTDVRADIRSGLYLQPTWSPDGRWIACVRNEEIYVMDADGKNLINLTNNTADDRYPSWFDPAFASFASAPVSVSPADKLKATWGKVKQNIK